MRAEKLDRNTGNTIVTGNSREKTACYYNDAGPGVLQTQKSFSWAHPCSSEMAFPHCLPYWSRDATSSATVCCPCEEVGRNILKENENCQNLLNAGRVLFFEIAESYLLYIGCVRAQWSEWSDRSELTAWWSFFTWSRSLWWSFETSCSDHARNYQSKAIDRSARTLWWMWFVYTSEFKTAW